MIWGITSTVSDNGDVGADPNKLVAITDQVGATTAPAGESFLTTRAAGFGEVCAASRSRPPTASRGIDPGGGRTSPPGVRSRRAVDLPRAPGTQGGCRNHWNDSTEPAAWRSTPRLPPIIGVGCAGSVTVGNSNRRTTGASGRPVTPRSAAAAGSRC